jgi:hypothetical protein
VWIFLLLAVFAYVGLRKPPADLRAHLGAFIAILAVLGFEAIRIAR